MVIKGFGKPSKYPEVGFDDGACTLARFGQLGFSSISGG